MTRHSVAPNNRQPSSLSIIKQWLPIPKNHLKLKPSLEQDEDPTLGPNVGPTFEVIPD